jgi:hypothetical protein
LYATDDATIHTAVWNAADGDTIVVTQSFVLESRLYVGNKNIIIMGAGNGITISRGAGFAPGFDPARQDFVAGMIEVASNGSVRSSLTLRNITLDDMNDPDSAAHTDPTPISGGNPAADWAQRVYDSVISSYSGEVTVTLGDGARIVNIGGASAIRMAGGTLNLESGSYVEGSNANSGYYGAIWIQAGAVLNYGTVMDGTDAAVAPITARYIYTDDSVTVNFSGKINNCEVRNHLFNGRVGGYEVIFTAGSEINGNHFVNTRAILIEGNNSLIEFSGKINGNNDTGSGSESSHLVDVSGNGNVVDLRGEFNNNSLRSSVIMVRGYGTSIITLHAAGVISGNTVAYGALRQFETNSEFHIYGTVSDNVSTVDNGGAFYLSIGKAIMYLGSRVVGNTAFGSGGGFNVNQGATLEIRGGEISGNTAECRRTDHVSNGWAGGGAISVTASLSYASKVIMTGGEIKNNTSSTVGGGIFITGRPAGHTFIMEGGTVKDNIASTDNGKDLAVSAALSGITSSLSGGHYISIGKNAVLGDVSLGAALYNSGDYGKTGVYLSKESNTVRLGNVGPSTMMVIDGRVTAAGYSGHTMHDGVWYSIDKTAGNSIFTITYPPGLVGDPNDYEWIAAIQPLGAAAADLGDTDMKILTPSRTADGLMVSVPLRAASGGTPVEGYAVVIFSVPKSTSLTLDAGSSGSGVFCIDQGRGPVHHAVMNPGDIITDSEFVISPSPGWSILSAILTAGDGAVFDKTSDALSGTLSISYSELASGTNTIFVVFNTMIVPMSNYIVATSDSGSTITPEGKISVPRHSSRTFFFSADEGYTISAVTVDGVSLMQAQVLSGSYTFYDITTNHTIDVTSRALRTDITLRIDIIEGKGRAEYSINGSPFEIYAGVVSLPEFCSLDVNAVADNGYSFVKWVDGTDIYVVPEISFADIGASIHLELYFEGGNDNGGSWWLPGLILLLLLAGLLLWFIIFYRRYYEVHIPESSGIVGAVRVHRKSSYRFSVTDGYNGAVFCRVGENGSWKQLFPDVGGEYLIPKGEATDDIYLERRP